MAGGRRAPLSISLAPAPRRAQSPRGAVPPFSANASHVGPKIAAARGVRGLQVALLFRHLLSPDGRRWRREGAIMMTDGTVNDFRDSALDNLDASLDHLTRCFCDADERL